ncbi:MAG TPA: SDR family NAD(P)-dependent oxidoreductase [Roseiflexaceae bacterium]|nr:SDR family NAD(P)-dependent oxidoreductase [Roseiflexaceae bacterium]
MNLTGLRTLITGGASGLGAATARRLAEHGAHVLLADLNEQAGTALAEELGSAAHFAATDVTDEASMAAAVATAHEQFGGLDALVCCAGIATAERTLGKEGPLALARFSRVVQINLIGTFNAVRLAAEEMAKNSPNPEGERGVIVMTASVAAFDGQIGQAAYSASKAGVAGMTLPLAREFARLGVRVVSVAPGIFDTPMMAGLPEAARASLGQQVPFPSRLGRPEEYAALVQHLVENVMLNGETIRLDGAIRMAPK